MKKNMLRTMLVIIFASFVLYRLNGIDLLRGMMETEETNFKFYFIWDFLFLIEYFWQWGVVFLMARLSVKKPQTWWIWVTMVVWFVAEVGYDLDKIKYSERAWVGDGISFFLSIGAIYWGIRVLNKILDGKGEKILKKFRK